MQLKIKNRSELPGKKNHPRSVQTKFYSRDWLIQFIILLLKNNKREGRGVLTFLPCKGGAYWGVGGLIWEGDLVEDLQYLQYHMHTQKLRQKRELNISGRNWTTPNKL